MSVLHYSQLSDVQALNSQRRYDFKSNPTRDQVIQFIEDIAVLMDARLSSLGFTIPVTTGTESLKLLRVICTIGAAAKAEESTYTSQAQVKVVIKPRYVRLWEQFEREMERIEANPSLLSDTTSFTEEPAFASYSQQNTTDETAEARVEIGEQF
jgi:hypothetical protein